VENDLATVSYSNSNGKIEHIGTFLTHDANKAERPEPNTFLDLELQKQKPIYLFFNASKASAARRYHCDITVEPRQIRSRKFFETTAWFLDYEQPAENRCRLEKLGLFPLVSAGAFTLVQLLFEPTTLRQLLSSQWIYWLAILLGIAMYKVSVTELKKRWVALSSLSIFVILSILANINDLIDLIQRFL
jgi:hypothetical protein